MNIKGILVWNTDSLSNVQNAKTSVETVGRLISSLFEKIYFQFNRNSLYVSNILL